MKKPLIVLTPQAKPMEAPFEQVYHYTNGFYMQAVRQAGGIPLLPPYLEETDALSLLEQADGLFLTGGGDVSPDLYGQADSGLCGGVNPRRDRSDLCLLKAALALRKPVLCVCRGCQLGNVFFGGTLYQDLPSQAPSRILHSAYDHYFDESAHRVRLVPGSPLANLYGEPEIGANSLHHQAVKDLGPGLKPMAIAPDGIVESWYLPDPAQWLWAVQWHPEMLQSSSRGEILFQAFLSACRSGNPTA